MEGGPHKADFGHSYDITSALPTNTIQTHAFSAGRRALVSERDDRMQTDFPGFHSCSLFRGPRRTHSSFKFRRRAHQMKSTIHTLT